LSWNEIIVNICQYSLMHRYQLCNVCNIVHEYCMCLLCFLSVCVRVTSVSFISLLANCFISVVRGVCNVMTQHQTKLNHPASCINRYLSLASKVFCNIDRCRYTVTNVIVILASGEIQCEVWHNNHLSTS